MGEERIKSEDELKQEQEPLSREELDQVAGGAIETAQKYREEDEK
jgi:hypothetical protein